MLSGEKSETPASLRGSANNINMNTKVMIFVTRMGFEPMTPTLKVLCSTC